MLELSEPRRVHGTAKASETIKDVRQRKGRAQRQVTSGCAVMPCVPPAGTRAALQLS